MTTVPPCSATQLWLSAPQPSRFAAHFLCWHWMWKSLSPASDTVAAIALDSVSPVVAEFSAATSAAVVTAVSAAPSVAVSAAPSVAVSAAVVVELFAVPSAGASVGVGPSAGASVEPS